MAIIKIPSKKIYDNPKHGLSKNYINKVEAKENKLDFKKEFDDPVYTYKKDLSGGNIGFGKHELSKTKVDTLAPTNYLNIYAELYTFGDSVSFPTKSEDGRTTIVKVNEEQDSISAIARKTTITYEFATLGVPAPTTPDQGLPPTLSELQALYPDVEPEKKIEDSVEVPHSFSYGTLGSNIGVDFGEYNNFAVSMSDDYISATATNQRVAAYVTNATYFWNSNSELQQWFFLEYVSYEPKELTFSVYGDTEEYKDASNNRSYGTGNDYFKMSTNELMQETAELDGVPVVEANANAIISEYKNGKETYELLCSIGEYYDNDGVVSVSVNDNAIPYISYDLSGDIKVYTKKDIGIFNIGDLVVPYKPSASGDVPISFKSDGKTPKIFRVVGVTPIFDGAVWQLLNLLETNLEEQRFATAYVGAVPHTSTALLKPIRFYSYVENTYNLGDEVKEVYYRGKKLPEEYANGDSTNVEYYNGSEIAYHYAYFKDGVLTIRTVSSTDNISGSLLNWNGVTPEVQPTTLTFELKKS